MDHHGLWILDLNIDHLAANRFHTHYGGTNNLDRRIIDTEYTTAHLGLKQQKMQAILLQTELQSASDYTVNCGVVTESWNGCGLKSW